MCRGGRHSAAFGPPLDLLHRLLFIPLPSLSAPAGTRPSASPLAAGPSARDPVPWCFPLLLPPPLLFSYILKPISSWSLPPFRWLSQVLACRGECLLASGFREQRDCGAEPWGGGKKSFGQVAQRQVQARGERDEPCRLQHAPCLGHQPPGERARGPREHALPSENSPSLGFKSVLRLCSPAVLCFVSLFLPFFLMFVIF